jgi:hypothetical protein
MPTRSSFPSSGGAPILRLGSAAGRDATPEAVARVLDRPPGGSETLIVVSTHLSHFHDYKAPQRLYALCSPDRGRRLGQLWAGQGLRISHRRVPSHRGQSSGFRLQRLSPSNSGDTAGTRRAPKTGSPQPGSSPLVSGASCESHEFAQTNYVSRQVRQFSAFRRSCAGPCG